MITFSQKILSFAIAGLLVLEPFALAQAQVAKKHSPKTNGAALMANGITQYTIGRIWQSFLKDDAQILAKATANGVGEHLGTAENVVAKLIEEEVASEASWMTVAKFVAGTGAVLSIVGAIIWAVTSPSRGDALTVSEYSAKHPEFAAATRHIRRPVVQAEPSAVHEKQ